MEGFLFADSFEASGKEQFPVTVSFPETGNELAGETRGSALYRQEEG